MKILFLGDIFGKSGRRAVKDNLLGIVKRENVDFVIANAENTTHGRSLSISHYKELKELGVDAFTFGNHTWHLDEIYEVLKNSDTIRPLNLMSGIKQSINGEGTRIFNVKGKNVRVTNLLGLSVTMKDNIQTNPFVTIDNLLKIDKSDIHFIDLHAETTSEKNAFFQYFKGRVSTIVGTHTHVQTNDDRIENGTAYITDVGSCGSIDGIIGAKKDEIIKVFLGEQSRFKLEPDEGKYQFCAICIEYNEKYTPIKTTKYLVYEN